MELTTLSKNCSVFLLSKEDAGTFFDSEPTGISASNCRKRVKLSLYGTISVKPSDKVTKAKTFTKIYRRKSEVRRREDHAKLDCARQKRFVITTRQLRNYKHILKETKLHSWSLFANRRTAFPSTMRRRRRANEAHTKQRRCQTRPWWKA